MILIDVPWCVARKACHSLDWLRELLPQPCPLLGVLTRTDGPWATVSVHDRIWVGAQALAIPFMVRVLSRLFDRGRAAGYQPDPRSLVILSAFRAGRMPTVDERNAARSAAGEWLWKAEWIVARVSMETEEGNAAWIAARESAGWYSEERQAQLADLIDLSRE
jgi:hypothetical protein